MQIAKKISIGVALVIVAVLAVKAISYNPASVNGNAVAAKEKESPKETKESKTRAEIEAAIRSIMVDPDAAIIGNITIVNDKNACAKVNGKNQFGGYVGERDFLVFFNAGVWHALSTEFSVFYTCEEAAIARANRSSGESK